MASNGGEWAALPQRRRPDKRTREHQSQVLARLREMFGASFEADVIATVANHCQYKLEAATETLITLSSQPARQPSNADFLEWRSAEAEAEPWQADEFPSTGEPWLEAAAAAAAESPREERPPRGQARRLETASLCGLKVQYRPKGLDYRSDEDADADVVIEDEASDYRVEPEPASACHFLGAPDCASSRVARQAECASAPSPSPRSPRRQPPSAHEGRLQRVESDIARGWRVMLILRGCPGSGKSHLARSLVARASQATDYREHVFSADDYFSRANGGGRYLFDPSKLHDAHACCQSRVASAARRGLSPIVVDNTNTQAWEMKPYALLAVENGYIVETLEPDTAWARKPAELAKRNQHGVPRLKIQMMLERYEPNISGDRLIRMFNLGYAPYNRPPQMRKLPALSAPEPALPRAPQESALSTIAREYSNLERLCSVSAASEPARFAPPPPLLSIEGNSFKEENLIDLSNLGAIGSERKASSAEQAKLDEACRTELPIGSQRKASSTEEAAQEEAREATEPSPGAEPAALDEAKADAKTSGSGALGSAEGDEEEDYFLDAEERVSRDSESSKNSATPSDHSADFEKLDMVDVGAKPENKPEGGQTPKSETPAVGLGSIFSYIKNSFLGSEKEEPALSPKVENEEAAASQTSRAEQLERVKRECGELTTTAIPVGKQQHDTLSQKLSSHAAASIVANGNLTIDVQENVEVVDEPRNDNDQVVQELLEACAELQLVETLDYSAKREEEDDESIISEKSFAQELKNLQAFMKSKEDSTAAAKASIDVILNDKNNILKEQQSRSSPPASELVPSDDNGNAVNNINLISWRESPFPVENARNVAEMVETDAQAKSDSHDKETFTDPYDFNVAFIGADDFKVLEARNRSINEANLPAVDELQNLDRKLMLHKGTMTNTTGIIYSETIFDLEVDPLLFEHRGEELVEKFAYIPRSYVLEVYDNLCKRDFGWATEYLTNLEFEDVVMAMSMSEADKEQILNGLERKANSAAAEAAVANKSEPDKQRASGCESWANSPQRQTRRARKSRPKSLVTQELERELQEKFVLSQDSYPSHTLRVKRWKNRDFSPARPADEEHNLINFEDQPRRRLVEAASGLHHDGASSSDDSSSEEEEEEEGKGKEEEEEEEEEPVEETMELTLGYEFIRVLEAEFGQPDFANSGDGLFPVIQIRKSMAQELYALWIDSMQRQLWSMHEQLDAMIAKDAEYARTLEAEQDEDVRAAIAASEPEAPNLREIMDMEMALAMYRGDAVSSRSARALGLQTKERRGMSHGLMEALLTRDTLLEMFPDCERDVVLGIYEAHGRNFAETVKVVKDNCLTKCKLTMADILKKRRHLMDELRKESRQQTAAERDDQLPRAEGPGEASYEDALQQAHESRSQALEQLALRNENFRKANEAYRRKSPQVAAYYSDVAKLHIRNMEAANSAAASAFLAAQAHALEAEDTLDLHFLHVAEAKEALRIYLDHQFSQLSPGGRKHIFIITGRGLRSLRGQSKIKPAVAKELNSKNLRFTEVNPGMLKVFLRKK